MTEKLECSPLSQEDLVAGSVLCLHNYIKPELRKYLENYKEYAQFCNDYAASKVFESLANQQMLKTKIKYADIIKQKVSAFLSTNSQENWKFSIDGFQHTGKTTLLGFLAYECLIQISRKKNMEKVFFFPLNWERICQKISDVNSLYNEYIISCVKLLSYQHAQIFPLTNNLINWFLALSFSKTSPPLPSSIKGAPLFPVTQIESLGSQICTAFKNGSQNVSFLLELICSLPHALAQIFGFDQSILIYDHLDLADISFSMEDEEAQTSSTGSLLPAIAASLGSTLSITSIKNQMLAKYDHLFNPTGILSTFDFMPEDTVSELLDMTLTSPQIRITPQMCRGCPQIVYQYSALQDSVLQLEAITDPNLPQYGIHTLGYAFQMRLVKTQVSQLFTDFISIGIDSISEDLITQIQMSDAFHIETRQNSK